MPVRFVSALALGVALGACVTEPAAPPPEPPTVVDFADACVPDNDGRELAVVGYADAFPTVLSCSEGEGGARLCPVAFHGDRRFVLEPEQRAESDSSLGLSILVPEGDAPNRVDATGFGVGPALVLVADDGTRADPYDRLRVTGRFSADSDVSGGAALLCAFEAVRTVEVVEPANPSWRETAGGGETMEAFLDSLNAERSQVE